MLASASQAAKFYEQVVRDGCVFTFVNDGGMLVYPVQAIEVVPFWSSRSRMLTVLKNHPKYAVYAIDETDLVTFLDQTMPLLAGEGIHVGVNWSGERLTGYNLPVDDVLTNIAYWQEKVATAD
ncbi:Protein of unknown function [Neorhodopirellula lusitana]|uniref:DUF2750 domain-containing protein n=1 Tax=Neorhodopirellula lusitana TaxID=445327 RepID=A0ABY1Q046_9BACT|nr:DUF2750 domain-containing protein [Neorhodopirellula lusitana]SMP54789.1 Protein of unknown function [Neorhodopirellula lusitana]